MTTTNLSVGLAQPSAKIAVNRSIVKHYDNKIYLRSGTHFEIELFNPKTTKVLAKIYMNGVSISSSGIVLMPGQRVFLERWLDDAKKFLFESYSVEDSSEAKAAIANNGKVKVEFYDEYIPSNYSVYPTSTIYCGNSPSFFGSSGTTNGNYGYSTLTASNSIGESSISNCLTSFNVANSTPTSSISLNSAISKEKEVETGRAEKGESSNQSFVNDSSSYNSWLTSYIELQILPESAKPVEQIRNYCVECGTRKKGQGWKFCPTCGTKI